MVKGNRTDVLLKKNLIIRSIANAGTDGRHIFEIVNDTKLSRSTVVRLCNILKKEGYITKRNKYEPYRLTDRLYGDPSQKTFLFRSEAIRNLKRLRWASDQSEFLNRKRYSELVEEINSRKDVSMGEQLLLFGFANRIGALTVYIMIQAMRPYKHTDKISIERIDLQGKERDRIAKLWLESIDLHTIFREFSKLEIVKRGRAIHNLGLNEWKMKKIKSAEDERRVKYLKRKEIIQGLDTEEKAILEQDQDIKEDFYSWLDKTLRGIPLFAPEDPKWSFYELTEADFKKLVNAYSAVYPEIYRDLEEIRNNLDSYIMNIRKGLRS